MKPNPTSIATLAATLLSTLTIAPAGAQAADSCPNAAIRAQQHAEYLPDCRAYELVSPVEKNGVDVMDVFRLADDGNAIAWKSIGAYANPEGFNVFDAYVARRGADGRWKTSAMYPRASETNRPGVTRQLGGLAFSADLSSAAIVSGTAFDPADSDFNGFFDALDVYRIQADEDPVWISNQVDGPPPNETGFGAQAALVGVSDDGSSIFFTTAEALSDDVTSGSATRHLYRWRNGRTELVGRDENGAVFPSGTWLGGGGAGALPGTGNAGVLPDSSAVASDGSAFVYTNSPSGGGQLYLHRSDGSVTLISASQTGASSGMPSATGAVFRAALPDFSAIYFGSRDQLSDDAPVGGGDYRYDVKSGELTFSNPDEVLGGVLGPVGMVRVSDDGRYVYFASTSDLALGATAGEPNLYVKGPGGTRFIARLSNEDRNFTVRADITSPFTRSGLSADGTRLVFATAGRSTEYDNDSRQQVYVYDANLGVTRCVSCNPHASKSGGSADVSGWEEGSLLLATPRVISSDGQRVVFTSTEGLVAQDTNGLEDVYQDVGGVLSLISSGTSARDSKFVGMSADGSQVFFRTRSKLVSEDGDGGLYDLYSARVGGGFPDPAPTAACAGDACQGGAGDVPPVTVAGSLSFAGSGDVSGRGGSGAKVSVSAVRGIAGVSGRLRVTVTGKGRIAVSGSGLNPASVRVTRAGSYWLAVRLSPRARRALARDGRVRVRAMVRFTAAGGTARSRLVELTFRRAGSSRSVSNSKGGR